MSCCACDTYVSLTFHRSSRAGVQRHLVTWYLTTWVAQESTRPLGDDIETSTTPHTAESVADAERAQRRNHLVESLSQTKTSFGVGTLFVVEQSSWTHHIKVRPRGGMLCDLRWCLLACLPMSEGDQALPPKRIIDVLVILHARTSIMPSSLPTPTPAVAGINQQWLFTQGKYVTWCGWASARVCIPCTNIVPISSIAWPTCWYQPEA